MDLAKCWKTLPLHWVFFFHIFFDTGHHHIFLFPQCWFLKVDNDFQRVYWLSLAGKGIIWIVQPFWGRLPCGFIFWPPRFPDPPQKNMLKTHHSFSRLLVWWSTTPEITLGNIFMGNLDATFFFLWAPGIMPPILVTRATAAVPVYCWHFSWLKTCIEVALTSSSWWRFATPLEIICAKQLGSFFSK